MILLGCTLWLIGGFFLAVGLVRFTRGGDLMWVPTAVLAVLGLGSIAVEVFADDREKQAALDVLEDRYAINVTDAPNDVNKPGSWTFGGTVPTSRLCYVNERNTDAQVPAGERLVLMCETDENVFAPYDQAPNQ